MSCEHYIDELPKEQLIWDQLPQSHIELPDKLSACVYADWNTCEIKYLSISVFLTTVDVS